jgi:hypothetical protein
MPPKRKSHLTGLQGLGPAEIKDDLIAMGLGKERVDEIMEKKDTADPSISPPRPFETQGRAQRQQRVGKGKGKKPAYEPLCLAKNKSSSPLLVPLIHIASCWPEVVDWVLFDPELHEWPKTPPPVFKQFEKFETYVPGNPRIIEYNLISEAVRIKCTPRTLREGNKTVEYTPTGPKVVDPEKPEEPEVAEEEAPPPKTKGKRKRAAEPAPEWEKEPEEAPPPPPKRRGRPKKVVSEPVVVDSSEWERVLGRPQGMDVFSCSKKVHLDNSNVAGSWGW